MAMKKLFILIAFFLILVTVLPVRDLTLANELDKLNLPKATLNPGDFYYPVKRLWEKLMQKLQFNEEAKIKSYTSLVDLRMSELDYVIKTQRLGELERATQRFSFQLGVLSEYLIRIKSQDKKVQVASKLESFIAPLEELRDKFPANSSFWMLIQHDINSAKQYLEKLIK